MTVDPIVDQIMQGSVCPAEIWLSNAERLMSWVKDTDRHHTADTCNAKKKKDCAHAPGQQTVEFAAAIASEAANVCACGAHGVDSPGQAATIAAEFIERWT